MKYKTNIINLYDIINIALLHNLLYQYTNIINSFIICYMEYKIKKVSCFNF